MIRGGSWARYVPHTLTFLSLLFGAYALELSFGLHFKEAFYCLVLAAFFDMLDGWAARFLGVSSDFGKMLDSLSDMVVFGVVPVFWLRGFLLSKGDWVGFLGYLPFLMLFCCAWRLARFSTEPSRGVFRGLPTPASALFITSFIFVEDVFAEGIFAYAWGIWMLAGLSVLCAAAMVSHIPLLSVSHMRKDSVLRYIMLLASIGFIVWLREGVFLGLIPFYVLLSLFYASRIKQEGLKTYHRT